MESSARRRPRLVAVIISSILFLSGFAACGGSDDGTNGTGDSGGTADAAKAVTIKDLTFNPAELRVTAGTTVTWTNEDAFNHSVVAVDKSFVSDDKDGTVGFRDDPFEHAFPAAGTFAYSCGIHDTMTGTIVVT